MILKEARIKAGFTQETLAKRLGVKRLAVIKWENGQKRPTKLNVVKLCLLFDTTAEELGLKAHYRKGNTK